MLKPLRDLGLEPPVAARIVITPACGLASASRNSAVSALRTLRSAAQIVTEQLARLAERRLPLRKEPGLEEGIQVLSRYALG